MTKHLVIRATLLAAALWILPAAASAECATDADCPDGQVCRTYETCGGGAPCACPDCAPDMECPPCECPPYEPPECTATSECVTPDPTEIECASDADCPTDFACAAIPMPCATGACDCACPACEPNTDCPPCECGPCAEPEPCDPVTVHRCSFQPKPCTADSECKPGFACTEVCSGASGGCACPACACATCPEGAECPPCDCPAEPLPCDCDETKYEGTCENYCAPARVVCATDADCADGFTCQDEGSDCLCAPCPAEGLCPDCNCAAPQKVCMPAGWIDYGMGAPEDFGPAVADSKNAQTGGTDDEQDGAGEAIAKAAGCAAEERSAALLPSLLLALFLGGAFVALRRPMRVRRD